MSFRNKIIEVRELKNLKYKLKKKKIILCHGVFDLLHIGHINYFREKRQLLQCC